jgi:hypothetical protein
MGAQPLKSSGKVVTETGKKITDDPFMEGKEMGWRLPGLQSRKFRGGNRNIQKLPYTGA